MSKSGFAADLCQNIWAQVYAYRLFDFPPHAKVLEIGCAEADWLTPMLDCRPDLQVHAIDWRRCERPGVVVQGDVLTTDAFEWGTFDAVVGISSIEHIGLGHYEQDPADDCGDVNAVIRAWRWLKPGGWFYLDVPYDPTGYRLMGQKCRIYDDTALEQRFLIDGHWQKPVDVWFGNHAGKLTEKPTQPESPFSYVALHLVKRGTA